jgi:GAF domain-containing protein
VAGPPSTGSDPTAALVALAEEVVLDQPAVEDLLTEAARAAAGGVGLSCGITYVARYGVVTVASSDARADAVDEIQYSAGGGPCLEALHTGAVVRVEDQATDTRWGSYPELAMGAGVRSSVSFPLTVDDRPIGALNVYSTRRGPLPADEEAAALLASAQLTGVLQAVRRLAAGVLRDPAQARQLQERHDVDIATGILMARHGCSDTDAREVLAQRAATQKASLWSVAVRIVSDGEADPGPTS